MEAAVERVLAKGKPKVEIIIPLTPPGRIWPWPRWCEDAIAQHGNGQKKLDVTHLPMIETLRLPSGLTYIAEERSSSVSATNDLTQLTFGFSRDDVEGLLMSTYLELGC